MLLSFRDDTKELVKKALRGMKKTFRIIKVILQLTIENPLILLFIEKRCLSLKKLFSSTLKTK